ncbi:MAG: ABC transporter ATP-binding protein [Lachnospiraceae bacterium]|nr:ABC transporter ATP-binding protein [Lachnospiraceae bacterium]
MTKKDQKNFAMKKYLFNHAPAYLAGILLLLLVDVTNLYIPQFTAEIIDGLSTDGGFASGDVTRVVLKILLCGLLIMAGRFGWRYFILGSSRKIQYEIRGDMFSHLESLSARFYNAHKTGDLMAHFTNDLNAIREATGWAVITVFDGVIMTVMVLVKMILYVDFNLTLLAFVPMILIAFGCYLYGKIAEVRMEAKQNAFSTLSDKAQESMAGIRVIKSFVQEKPDFESFEKTSEDCMEKNLNVVKLRILFIPLLELVIGISMMLSLLFGGRMVLNSTITIGQYVAFNSYIGMLVWPMIAVGDCINTFSQAYASYVRIKKIFDESPDIVDDEADDTFGSVKGDITFKDLTFRYPDGDTPVLKNINLHIAQGEMLGILGRTGSGKSSLSDLLLRVFDCPKGSLMVDGTPIDEIPLYVLHRDVAYVPQDNFLFSDTLEENIAFGLEEKVSDHPELKELVVKAAKAACIDENINTFPDKYQTIVGERGVTLSGGQKQRSSIARALLKDAPILILDDSLSAVDTDTEEQILANILDIRKNKTTIVIAHRISTLSKADHVAVLNDGEITEYGTHDELVKLGGFYANIFEKQQLEKELSAL